MAKRKSQVERAIESLEAERAVLDAAINKLRQELAKKPAAKPTAKRKAPVAAMPLDEAAAK
jgi:cell division protein FtsB